MSTPIEAKYKQLQALRPTQRLLASSADLRAYQLEHGESALAASNRTASLQAATMKVQRSWRRLPDHKKRAVLRAVQADETTDEDICAELGVQPEHVRAAKRLCSAG